MEPMSLFTAALGLAAPWQVNDVRLDAKHGRIDFDVAYSKGSRFACPACAAAVERQRRRVFLGRVRKVASRS